MAYFLRFAELAGEGVGTGVELALVPGTGRPVATGVGAAVIYTVTVGCGVGTSAVAGADVGALRITETTPRSLRFA